MCQEEDVLITRERALREVVSIHGAVGHIIQRMDPEAAEDIHLNGPEIIRTTNMMTRATRKRETRSFRKTTLMEVYLVVHTADVGTTMLLIRVALRIPVVFPQDLADHDKVGHQQQVVAEGCKEGCKDEYTDQITRPSIHHIRPKTLLLNHSFMNQSV